MRCLFGEGMNAPTQHEVAVRVGVLVTQRIDGDDDGRLTIDEEANSVDFTGDGEERISFSFDVVTNQNNTQKLYPKLLQPLCVLVSSGYHGAVLVSDTGKENILHEHGVIKQMVTDLFTEIDKSNYGKCFTTVSFIQFYPDDSGVDILNPEKQDLNPRTHPVLGVLVEGLCEITVESPEEAFALYEESRHPLRVSSGSHRCSSLYSINVEQRLQEEGGGHPRYCRSKLQLFNFADGARKGDLSGVSTLEEVLALMDTSKTASNRLLPFLLIDTLTRSNCVLLCCIKPQGLLAEEITRTLALSQRIRTFVTRVIPVQWCPREAAQDMREKIRELRTCMVLQEDSGEGEIRRLEDLIQALQVVKDQDWVKRRNNSKEVMEKRQGYKVRHSEGGTPGHNTDRQMTTERLKQLQDQLRQEIEAHMRDGKVGLGKSQKSVEQIQRLREALREEDGKLKAASREPDHLRNTSSQTEDGFSLLSEADLEYSKALHRRTLLMEEHSTMIQEELEKMERELGAETAEGLGVELLRLRKERQILVLQLEALRREKMEAERNLESLHNRHTKELLAFREESLQVFSVFRQVFEEQRDTLEDMYQTLLLEAIQDAVYLSSKNQELQAEKKGLQRALAELKDAFSVQAHTRGKLPQHQ